MGPFALSHTLLDMPASVELTENFCQVSELA